MLIGQEEQRSAQGQFSGFCRGQSAFQEVLVSRGEGGPTVEFPVCLNESENWEADQAAQFKAHGSGPSTRRRGKFDVNLVGLSCRKPRFSLV